MIISANPLHIALFGLFVLSALVQVWYWMAYYRRAAFPPPPPVAPVELPALSVIICARNEAENLERFLPSVLEQDYPKFEVIVVNDCSEDNTDNVLGDMVKRYPRLKVSYIHREPGFPHAKKLAMLIGIKAASNDLLVFTDADCQPVSDRWLQQVAASTGDSTDIVIGYGGYMKGKGLLNSYVRYETIAIALQYLGMALAGRPYMGVGRNLSYRRSFFFAMGGFGPHNHLLSGDDDLFVNRNARPGRVSALTTGDSFTLSVPPASAGEWVKQKRRHFSAAPYYRLSDRIRLFAEPLSRIIYYGLLITLSVMLLFWPFLIFVALSRLVVRSVVLYRAGKTFNEPGLWFISLFFDILSPFVSTALYLSGKGKSRGRDTWK